MPTFHRISLAEAQQLVAARRPPVQATSRPPLRRAAPARSTAPASSTRTAKRGRKPRTSREAG